MLAALTSPVHLTALTLESFPASNAMADFLTRHPHLRKLALLRLNIGANDGPIVDSTCNAIQHMPNLRTFRVNGIGHGMDQAVLYRILAALSAGIEELDIDQPFRELDILMLMMLGMLHTLRKLRIRMVVPLHIVDNMVRGNFFLARFPNLEVLEGDGGWMREVRDGMNAAGRSVGGAWDPEDGFLG